MTPTQIHHDEHATLWHGDCIETMRLMPDASVDAVVTDPPYALDFMGHEWDRMTPGEFQHWCEKWASQALRVLKPGGHLLAFGGTRTFHRLAAGIEDAGFEIRDSLAWLYAQGFPKSMNVSLDSRFCQGHPVPSNHASDMRGMRPSVQPSAESSSSGQASDMLEEVQWDGTRARIREARTQGTGGLDGGESRVGSREDDRPAEPGVEGRSDGEAVARELSGGDVHEVPAVASADGSRGRVRDDAQARDGRVGRASADADGGRASSGSRPVEQLTDEPRTVADERGPQAGRGWPTCGVCGKPQVSGLGTALKPAFEPIIVARKPLIGTVAANVLAHGTGALNIDGTRIGSDGGGNACPGGDACHCADKNEIYAGTKHPVRREGEFGRWPANVVLDESQAAALDKMAPAAGANGRASGPTRTGGSKSQSMAGKFNGVDAEAVFYDDEGGASRFFYTAKAPQHERPKDAEGVGHPTVKPVSLMRWLVKLVTPPGGTVLEPFAGSGTTIEAALTDGFHVIAIEREAKYIPLCEARLARPMQGELF